MVTLAVRDLERSHQFYITGLGWQAELYAPHEVLMIRVGAHTLLSLWSETEFEAEVGAIARGEGAPPITLAHNVATAEEVDEILTLAARIGAGNIAPGQQRNWGGYSGYFADPDGYRWEIAMNPALLANRFSPEQTPQAARYSRGSMRPRPWRLATGTCRSSQRVNQTSRAGTPRSSAS